MAVLMENNADPNIQDKEVRTITLLSRLSELNLDISTE